MPIWPALPHAMRFPEQRIVPGRLGPGDLCMKRQVPTPLVDTHDRDAPIEQPLRCCGAHARAGLPVVLRADILVAPGADQDDRPLSQLRPCPGDRGLHVGDRDRIVVCLVRHIEDNARPDATLERYLIDRRRRGAPPLVGP